MQPGEGSQTVEDPLIAALPPNTDFITYLTLLEYQLTPQNLRTLNRLLQEDDGTLASEIGWDLLKLVLPILKVEPAAAHDCLDIIARRGNPREVIVRVSEELEGLGQHDGEEDEPGEADQEGLHTFAGEAPRVHLGNMKLDGMPEPAEKVSTASDGADDHVPGRADEEVVFGALLSMLGVLHPRIKTQYPSRFLATSLPAALGAYRRLSMDKATTEAFVNTLVKLGARKRPALPPRVSTQDALPAATAAAAAAETAALPSSMANATAPLPDPDSKREPATPSNAASADEAAINQRLLQAVLLEVVDERTTESTDAQPPMTARLRAALEPHSLTSLRRAALAQVTATDEAKKADSIRAKFIAAANDLKLDLATAIHNLVEPPPSEPEQEGREEDVSAYPTSPSQIPFPATGLLLLYSMQQYVATDAQQGGPERLVPTTHILKATTHQYRHDPRLRVSTPAIDSLLSLLYTIFCVPSARSLPTTVASPVVLLETYHLLRDIFTSCPDQDLRDNAHHIASHLLHGHADRETRVTVIKDLLSPGPMAMSATREAQSGNLRAVAVEWLKEEVFPTGAVREMMQRMAEEQRGLEVEVVHGLGEVLFPPRGVAEVPGEVGGEDVTEQFGVDLPFFISGLNLLGLLGKWAEAHGVGVGGNEAGEAATGSAGAGAALPAGNGLADVIKRGEAMLVKLEAWKGYLDGKIAGDKGGDADALEVGGIGLSDAFALEDAVGRVREVLAVDT